MCFFPPTPRVSRRCHAVLSSSPPRVVTLLNLTQHGERNAVDTLHQYTTGRRKVWRILSMRRDADALHVAVEWPRRRSSPWFALVSIGFADGLVDCRILRSERSARAALAAASRGGGKR